MRRWLINGPPGSDHEAVARAIHHQSMRASRAIICVNCLSTDVRLLAIAKDAARAQTSSTSCSLANGGTLYLEGIEHLPPESQLLLVEQTACARGGTRRCEHTRA